MNELDQPFYQLETIETAGMETSAFLGALDDLHASFLSTEPDRNTDQEIMRRINGVYDQASQYSSAEMSTALSLFQQVSERLGEMACGDDHFRNALEEHTGLSFDNHDDHGHENHKLDDKNANAVKDAKAKEKKKAVVGRQLWALLFTRNLA